MRHPLDRSGLAALSDFAHAEWRELFRCLEDQQGAFLAHESAFRSPHYRWPRDPLHQWSRAWEYPYVYHHLCALRRERTGDSLHAIDVGSGVTFFPFAVAEVGYRVTCADIDPICASDFRRAAAAVPTRRGIVEPLRLSDGRRLPFESCEADAVCCISVLEHIPTWETTVEEMVRILKPGGLLLLTIDLDLIGRNGFGPVEHRRLLDVLAHYFTYRWPEVCIHPADVLDSNRGPYRLMGEAGLRRVVHYAKQLAKPLFGRRPIWAPSGCRLVVHGLALTRT